jgi:hypothetical protein
VSKLLPTGAQYAARDKQQLSRSIARDLACPNRLGVARGRGYAREVVVAQKGGRGRVGDPEYLVRLPMLHCFFLTFCLCKLLVYDIPIDRIVLKQVGLIFEELQLFVSCDDVEF